MAEESQEKTAEEAQKKKDVHALVLSGGGAHGAYEVGVMKALFAGKSPTTNYQPLDPDLFLGTSVGSMNSSYLVSHWDDKGSAANTDLEQLWLNEVSQTPPKFTNGVSRIRGLNALNPFCYFPNPLENINDFITDMTSVSGDMSQRIIEVFSGEGPIVDRLFGLMEMSIFISLEPYQTLIDNNINFAKLRNSQKGLVIAATNWAKGEIQFFRKQEMSDQLGPSVIMASSAVPGLFPPTKVGAFNYVDGGVLMNTPLRPAIDAGANIIHVITLNPEVEKIPLPDMPNTIETVMRQQTISWVKAVDQNIKEIYNKNRLLEVFHLTLQTGEELVKRYWRAGEPEPDNVILTLDLAPEIHDLVERRSRPGEERLQIEDYTSEFSTRASLKAETAPYVPVTVYLYRPNAALGGALGMGHYGRNRLIELIERGFEDAVNFQESDKNYVAPYPLRYKLARARVDEVARRTRVDPFVREPHELTAELIDDNSASEPPE